jgi:hypothetical protein
MNLIILLLVALLIALVALLWYGIRTHKTVTQLEAKVTAMVDSKITSMKTESTAAVEAAKAKL